MPESANQSEHASKQPADASQKAEPIGDEVPPPTPPLNEKATERSGRPPEKTPAPTTLATQPSSLSVLNRDRPMAWIVLLALLALGALPIYTFLHADQTLSRSQSQALDLAEESWRHRYRYYQNEFNLESLVPMSEQQPQLRRAPGDVWLYGLAFSRLDPLTTKQADLMAQMRLLTAGFGLLAIAAIFWAGFSIGGLTTASYAGLIAVSCPVFTWYARQGTIEVPLLAFQSLAVASALWALRPLRPTPSVSRQALGWAVCGFTLGAAVLIGGLPSLPVVILPILVMSIMCPNRISHLLGLIASICIAGLMVMPWAVYVHSQDTDIWEYWIARIWPNHIQSVGTLWESLYEHSLFALVLLLPWTLWLLGALAQPFSTSTQGVRRRVFIGWAWLVSVGSLAVIGPSVNGIGGVLILLPAAAVMIGQCLRLFSDRSAEGRHARVWRYTRWGHMAFIALASLAIPGSMLFQEALVNRGLFSGPIVSPMPWYFWSGLALSLMLITLMSMRFALRHYPGKATICWSIWTVVLVSVVLIPLSRGPMMNPVSDHTPLDITNTPPLPAAIPGDT